MQHSISRMSERKPHCSKGGYRLVPKLSPPGQIFGKGGRGLTLEQGEPDFGTGVGYIRKIVKTFFQICVVFSRKRLRGRRFAASACYLRAHPRTRRRNHTRAHGSSAGSDDIDGNEGSGDSSSEEDARALDDE